MTIAAALAIANHSGSAPSQPTLKSVPDLPVYAVPVAPSAPTPVPAPAADLSAAVRTRVPPPPVGAGSAILVDAISGQVLYEQNADDERPMASTTKIMTALLYCEHVADTDCITASTAACEVRDSSMHLKPGERVSAIDMLRAILLRSANDGCVAAAEHIAGSEAAFVRMMNDKAVELGALHTHFANPHGLTAPNHYTTARDLAIIARAAMECPRFREVVQTKLCRITRSIDHNDVTMRNHSHFLGHFPGADGIKTGWTVPAGHCYVGSATESGWQLISVVLKSPNYVADTSAMMNYGFRNFERHVVVRNGEPVGSCAVDGGLTSQLTVRAAKTVQYITRKGDNASAATDLHFRHVTAPVAAGAEVGTLTVSVDGRRLSGTSLIAMDAIAARPSLSQSAGHSPWRIVSLTVGILGSSLVSLRYGSRFRSRYAETAKSSRRRRRRVASRLRGDDFIG